MRIFCEYLLCAGLQSLPPSLSSASAVADLSLAPHLSLCPDFQLDIVTLKVYGGSVFKGCKVCKAEISQFHQDFHYFLKLKPVSEEKRL